MIFDWAKEMCRSALQGFLDAALTQRPFASLSMVRKSLHLLMRWALATPRETVMDVYRWDMRKRSHGDVLVM